MQRDLSKRRFYFVRHGQTDWNKKQLCQGQIDIPLSPEGRQEAEKLGHYLQSFTFSKVCSSPLSRALETAYIACPFYKPLLIKELKERHFGEIEGAPSSDMYNLEELEEKDPLFTPRRGVEPRSTFKERVLKGLHEAIAEDEDVLIISHGRVFLALCEILRMPLIRQIPNGSLIECSPDGDKWKVQLHNH